MFQLIVSKHCNMNYNRLKVVICYNIHYKIRGITKNTNMFEQGKLFFASICHFPVTGDIKLGVANSDFQPVRDLQATVLSGYMHKLGNSTFRIWKKRYFLLRQDNCLYYYKNEQVGKGCGVHKVN